MILRLPHHSHTTSPTMQRSPDFEQHTFAVFLPLMIPEPEFFDAGRHKKICALFIVPLSFRHAVLKAIEFDGQFCGGTINIQEVNSHWMLASEFESGKTSGAQHAPKFLFFPGLLTAQTAGVGDGAHGKKEWKPLSSILSPLLRRGERKKNAALLFAVFIACYGPGRPLSTSAHLFG
jgi:hypothetical protein